ncbi:DUF423 domain-containing protein [Cognatitamlana onchidii]|uniref:DUF423 domain-containing protein n=1 Tax=Cognatitamlana onchidii TaxID=2562860 RepID=UPI0010A6B12B|nr:DUF423 domain-containing protein [Algibacter onchidii]
MDKVLYLFGTALGALSIVLGAFGAHGLKELVSAEAIQSFETGVRYQMYHALFLLVLGNINVLSNKSKKLICYFVVAGVCLFSFSIYALATNTLTYFDFRVFGFITPIGGLLLIAAWSILFTKLLINTSKKG